MAFAGAGVSLSPFKVITRARRPRMAQIEVKVKLDLPAGVELLGYERWGDTPVAYLKAFRRFKQVISVVLGGPRPPGTVHSRTMRPTATDVGCIGGKRPRETQRHQQPCPDQRQAYSAIPPRHPMFGGVPPTFTSRISKRLWGKRKKEFPRRTASGANSRRQRSRVASGNDIDHTVGG